LWFSGCFVRRLGYPEEPRAEICLLRSMHFVYIPKLLNSVLFATFVVTYPSLRGSGSAALGSVASWTFFSAM
jgi:hypothetical protein